MTILETRDFFEGIFSSREEAQYYLNNHPEKESCRLLEFSFTVFPIYILEIGRGNFKYFENQNAVIQFLKVCNPDHIPKGKAAVFYYNDKTGESDDKIIETLALTLYSIQEPFLSSKVNADSIGGLEHEHFNYETLEIVKNAESLKVLGID